MLFTEKEVGVAKVKSQLVEAQKRIEEIKVRIGKQTDAVQKVTAKGKAAPSSWDWTSSYNSWSKWEDVEELKQAKVVEEEKVESIISKADNLGHYHDHSLERNFFERPEEQKFEECERNRIIGNYLFYEGIYVKAAEHYQIAIAFYEYCFPDSDERQIQLDELRRACLCNISLCYSHMGQLRQAVEAATTVLRETDGKHPKALFRRAQAYRLLDEYDKASADLGQAGELMPGDKSIIRESATLKVLSSKYAQKQHSFAKKSISRLSSADTTQTMHSLIDSGTGGASFASEQSSGERDRHHLEQVLNDAIPLEPFTPDSIQHLCRQIHLTSLESNS